MIIEAKAPRGGCLSQGVAKLTLTANSQEDQERLRNLHRAIIGEIGFQYIDASGNVLGESELNGEIT